MPFFQSLHAGLSNISYYIYLSHLLYHENTLGHVNELKYQDNSKMEK